MLRTQYVQVLSLRRRVLCQKVEILEYGVLPDRFRAAAPANELELGDSSVRFQIKFPARIAGTERDILDGFPCFENVWKTQQNPESVNRHIDLAHQSFQSRSSSQGSAVNPLAFEERSAILHR